MNQIGFEKLKAIKKVIAFVSGVITGFFLVRVFKEKIQETKPTYLDSKNNTTDIHSTNMRKFSEREQKAIQLMIDKTNGDYSFLLINIYNDIFYRKNVEYRHGKDKSELVFYRTSMEEVDHNKFLEIENEIMEISLLISYLRNNGLIYFIENTSVNELDTAGGFLKDGLLEVRMDLDSNIANILFDSLNHRVFVGYTLRDLAANGFKSIEERTLEEAKLQTIETKNLVSEAKRQADAATTQAQEATEQTKIAKKQTSLSYVAIIIALIAIAAGAFSSVWVAKNIVMDVKIDSTQVDAINSRLSTIVEKVDSLSTYKAFRMQEEQQKQEKAKQKKDK